MAQMFEREDKSNGSVQFLLKESTKYQKGQYVTAQLLQGQSLSTSSR